MKIRGTANRMQILRAEEQNIAAVHPSRRGFVLILVLALLFAATLLLARMATHSIRLKAEAATAVETLQRHWVAWSTAHVILPRSETLLSQMDESDAEAASESSTLRKTIQIAGRPLTVTVFDLDARLNLNTVYEIAGDSGVRKALGQSLPEFRSNVRTSVEPANGRPRYNTWADVVDVEAASPDFSMAEVYEAACTELTCWGSGQLNIDRCSDDQLLSLGKLLGRTSIMRQIIQERRKSPKATVTSLSQSLQLGEDDAAIVKRYVSDQSTCWGLIVHSENGGPEVFLVSSASSGAYRSRTQCFRMK